MTDEDLRRTPPDKDEWHVIWRAVRVTNDLAPLLLLATVMRNWRALVAGFALMLVIGGSQALERIAAFLGVGP